MVLTGLLLKIESNTFRTYNQQFDAHELVQQQTDLLGKLVDNPVNAVLTGNFIGILVWGVLLGPRPRRGRNEGRAEHRDGCRSAFGRQRRLGRFNQVFKQ